MDLAYLNQMRRYVLWFLIMPALSCFAQSQKALTDLPSLYINTFSQPAYISKTQSAWARLVWVEGNRKTVYDSVEIRVRGNGTAMDAKRPWRLKFAHKVKFLGEKYANARKWTLLANSFDKSMIRNAVTTEITQFIGMEFSPAACFVDVFLNDHYEGTYQISDQVEVGDHRVELTEGKVKKKNLPSDGFLAEVDGYFDGQRFNTDHSVNVRIHYPKQGSKNYEERLRTAEDFIRQFERRLFSDNYRDAESGYRPLVDSMALARWFIATELCGNMDAYWSLYFYKKRGQSKIFFGPLWDNDFAYDNDNRVSDAVHRLVAIDGFGLGRAWAQRMISDPWFCRLITRLWRKYRKDGIAKHVLQSIDRISSDIDASQQQNYQRWPINQRRIYEPVLHERYADYVADLRRYVEERVTWLDEHLLTPSQTERHSTYQAPVTYFQAPVTRSVTVTKSSATVPVNCDVCIINAGCGKLLDVDGSAVCVWQEDQGRKTQLWRFENAGNGLYRIVCRSNRQALADPSDGDHASLVMMPTDKGNRRQLWSIVAQGTSGQCNMVNAATGQTLNLSGGDTANGSKVVGYVTDARNSVSTHRLWTIKKVR